MRTRILAVLALVAILWPGVAAAKVLPMTDAMAVMDVVHEHLAHSDDLDISLVSEGVYAIAFWKAANGHPGGSSLLKKVASNWQLVKMQSTQFTAATELQGLGVPATQAKALIADLHKNAS